MAESKVQASNRWMQEGLREVTDQYRLDKIKEAKAKGLKPDKAREYAWEACLAQFPPPQTKPTIIDPPPDPPKKEAKTSEETQIGNITVPIDWPDLPANASLACEIGWVQANRLRVVHDRNGKTTIRLDRALSPAPSHAALGWLETSVRAYSKYVDVASRATSGQQDEAESIRRERLAIEDMKALLTEMKPVCPACGASLM